MAPRVIIVGGGFAGLAAARDLAKAEDLFRASGLEWVGCRPVTLTNDDHTGEVREVPAFGLTATISRANVAHWLLDAVERDGWFTENERTPQIAD